MKGFTSFIWLILALTIIVITGSGLVGIANLFPASLVQINGETCSLVRPVFGRYECGEMEEKFEKYVDWLPNQDVTSWYVGCTGSTPSCEVHAECKSYLTAPAYIFWYMLDGDTNWRQANVGEDTLSYVTTLMKGERLRIGGCANNLAGGLPGEIWTKYTPYGLYRYSSGAAKDLVNPSSCSISALDYNIVSACDDLENHPFEGSDIICNADTESTGLGNVLTLGGQLVFSDWVNYLDYYTDVSPIGSNWKSYNGRQVMCIPGLPDVDLYEIGTFNTRGSCYAVPVNKVASVECCDGEPTGIAGYTCENWALVAGGIQECWSTLECTDRGGWYIHPDYPNQIVREECISGECSIVETQTRECTTSVDCLKGYVCDMDTYKCVLSVPEVLCGDGICMSPFESAQNCPSDCTEADPLANLLNLLFVFIAALVISAVLVLALAFAVFKPLLYNRKLLLVSILGLALMLTLFFSPFVLSAASLII